MDASNDMNNTSNVNTVPTSPTEPQKAPEQTEAEKKAAFDAEEAKRKAEFDAKKAQKDEEIQIEWEINTMMPTDELFAKAKDTLSVGIERITQKSMKECVGAHIIAASQQQESIARHVFHPKKSLTNCFRYINRKAREYLEEYMKLTGEDKDRNGVIGIDIPDNLCYMWAEEYYSSTDIPEDHEDEEKFTPKTYTSSTKSSAKKTDKKKKAPAPKIETTPPQATENQMTLF